MLINQSEINSKNENIADKNRKDNEYYCYIKKHINNVREAWHRYFERFLTDDFATIDLVSKEDFINAIKQARINIEHHDDTKFLDDEFDAYRAKWYPTAKELELYNDEIQKQIMEDAYEAAWKHHYTHNPHHPKYWVNEDGTIRDMELAYIIEMICDWQAVSFMFNDNTLSWYENEAIDEKECFSANTRQIVDYIMYQLLA